MSVLPQLIQSIICCQKFVWFGFSFTITRIMQQTTSDINLHIPVQLLLFKIFLENELLSQRLNLLYKLSRKGGEPSTVLALETLLQKCARPGRRGQVSAAPEGSKVRTGRKFTRRPQGWGYHMQHRVGHRGEHQRQQERREPRKLAQSLHGVFKGKGRETDRTDQLCVFR